VIAMTDKDDPNNWWDGSNYRFTPTVAGYYLVVGSVNFAAVSGTYNCNIQIRKNGSTVVAITQDLLPSSISITQNATAIVYLNGSGDYVHMTGYTNANTTITGDASQLWTKLEAYKIN
jgi:predicted transcriptional regulator